MAELWLPDVDEEVQIAFELGDPRNVARVKLSDLTLADAKEVHLAIRQAVIGELDFLLARPVAGKAEPVSAEWSFQTRVSEGFPTANLDSLTTGLDVGFTNRLPADGDPDRPLITGRVHQEGKPLSFTLMACRCARRSALR